MGNMGSFISKFSMEESIGEIEKSAMETPTRFRKMGCEAYDPRSPTLNIDRTPILVETKVTEEREPVDPRSPSVGITRTPVIQCCQPLVTPLDWSAVGEISLESLNAVKEKEDLAQVLNFPELDCLSLSNIEEDQDSVNENPQIVKAAEETLDFSLECLTSSTPASTPAKASIKVKHMNKENSVVKTQSPSGSTPLKRVPFGDINRSLAASPRYHLQNKQKQIIRAEIQRSTLKLD